MHCPTAGLKALRHQAATMEFGQLQALFEPYLTWPERFGNTRRQRVYTHARVFWIFLAQVLSADGACASAVLSFLAWLKHVGGQDASPNTGAYCIARQGLPLEPIQALHGPLLQAMDGSGPRFWGRRVLVVDGSSVSMPDTEANQQAWPQPSTQKPGCGFPLMRILGIFSLGTGLWRAVATAATAVGERTLFHSLWEHFEAHDIVLADTGFCSYADYVLLERRGVDCVMPNHQRRKKGLRELKKLGRNDRLVQWFKGKQRPNWLSPQQWDQLPDTFLIRELTVHIDVPGFRTNTLVIATTLRDPHDYPAQAIAVLYRRRWAIELYFRDIKTTMGLDVLRCKTPAMVQKELWMHILAYNLIRALMLDAADAHRAPLDRISFKGTCDAIRYWAPTIALVGRQQRAPLIAAMLRAIARNRVPYRPNRSEPRAKKRRPKNYQLLTEPRHVFKETPHRGKYRAQHA